GGGLRARRRGVGLRGHRGSRLGGLLPVRRCRDHPHRGADPVGHRRGGDVPLRFVDRERAARRDPGGLRDDGLRRSAAVIVGGSAARIDARHSRRTVLHPLGRGQRSGGSGVPADHAVQGTGGELLPLTSSPTVVRDTVPEDAFGSTALATANEMIDAAGEDIFHYNYRDWYGLGPDTVTLWTEFLNGDLTADEAREREQDLIDA